MDFERRPLELPGPAKKKENIFILSLVKSFLEVHLAAAYNNNPAYAIKTMSPFTAGHCRKNTKFSDLNIIQVCFFFNNTCDNHFLHFSFSPLKVGTPLSALTPAPVMMAMCLALEKNSRNSNMSAKENVQMIKAYE